MSNCTYLCTVCGGIRRRSVVVWPLGKPMPPGWPVCHALPMQRLVKAEAEAATKLASIDRIIWAARGLHVYLRTGRRWRAALSVSEIARAREQLAHYRQRMAGPPRQRPFPRAWKEARQRRSAATV